MPVPPVSFNNQRTTMTTLSQAAVDEVDAQVAHIRRKAAEQFYNLNGDQRGPEVMAALIDAHTRLTVAQIGAKAALAVVEHSMNRAEAIAAQN